MTGNLFSSVGSNLLALPFSENLTPTSYDIPDDVSADQWLEIGRALGRVRGSVMWWVGDWWAFGEHAYGDRKAMVETEDWEGPRFQTCVDAATVCRAFETTRRRVVLSFTAHREVCALPLDWQDKVLDQAAKQGQSTREIREEVKRTRSFLAQGWTPDQLDRKASAEAGKCVVASIRDNGKGQRIDEALLSWAEASDIFVRIDRKTEWGNPFEIPDDGDRDDVIDLFTKHYWPFKQKLLQQASRLSGKVLGCWCHPEPCHGHLIAECVNRADSEGKTVMEIADSISLIDG